MDDFPATYAQAEYSRGLNRLDEYFHHGFISSKRPTRKEYVFPAQFKEQILKYLKRRETCGLSSSRMHSIKLYLERFATHLQETGVSNFKDLSASHINSYIEYVTKFTASTVSNSFGCLRGFLAYLHEAGCIADDLGYMLPKIRNVAEKMLPSVFSKDDVEAILRCVDRHSPTGKRDYAMLVLAARLGLRASDICGLRLSNLNWEKNMINIIQQKTGRPLLLPILNEVGDAIIDYLKVRPESDASEIFLRTNPPRTKLSGSALYSSTQKYMKRAGIRITVGKKHGPHSLRHSLSSVMLENRVPLPVISGILSHRSPETTKIYLKVDILQLRECAIDVPEVCRVKEGEQND